MQFYDLIATSAFGLESVVAGELKGLGFDTVKVENGRVLFTGDSADIARCNIWLRCSDRVLVRIKEFSAFDFEELYQGTLSVPWESIIPVNGKMHITGKSVKSKLHSVPDCQSIVKKAVVEAMKRKFQLEKFLEDGPVYKIEISMLNDTAELTIDTTGPGLHKRGYRQEQGEAPLKETLAAGLVLMSRWDPSRIFSDPMCGSGTIPIEAAMIGRRIAPGLKRAFSSEAWPSIPEGIWNRIRNEAGGMILPSSFKISASDIDRNVFEKARENARLAGVDNDIDFQKKPVQEFSSRHKFGCIISNPPYGERLSSLTEIRTLYSDMGRVFLKLDNWSLFILTANDDFEKLFGKKADRKRKLYNGKIKCNYYQYFGKPPWKVQMKENGMPEV